MSCLRRPLNRTRKSAPPPPPPPPHQADLTPPSTSPAESWTTHDSNLALLECLSTATPTRPALPAELILQILDHPTRFVPLHSVAHAPSADPTKPIFVIRDRATGIPVLYTRPFPARDVRRLRKVEFAFRSRDQGFSSCPDEGSWSWFEASLARFPGTDEDGGGQDGDDAAERTGSYGWTEEWMERHDKRLEDEPRYKIQTNRHASTEIQDYTIALTDEHELVRRAKEGDRVVLWGCACFPLWENRVYEAKISVLGVDDLAVEREEADQS